MKKNQSRKPQDSLLAAFKSEALLDKGTLRGIKGGLNSRDEVETNSAHTEGDTGNCDNDTQIWIDDRSGYWIKHPS